MKREREAALETVHPVLKQVDANGRCCEPCLPMAALKAARGMDT